MRRRIKRLICVFLSALLLLSFSGFSFAEATPAPAAVEAVAAAAVKQTKLRLQWQPVGNADGYRVFRYDAQTKRWLHLRDTRKTALTDDGLLAGTKYIYKVKAYARDGGSRRFGHASKAFAVLTLPTCAAQPSASIDARMRVSLTWQKTAGAAYYEIYLKTPGGSYSKLAETKKCVYTADRRNAPGTVYFKIRAVAASGRLTQKAPFSPALKVVVPEPVQPPAAPAQPRIAVGAGHAIVIDWPVVPGAESYVIQSRKAADSVWQECAVLDHPPIYTHNGETRTSYRYLTHGEADSGVWQFRVAAAVTQYGSRQTGAYSEPVEINYTYEPEPELNYYMDGVKLGISFLYDPKQEVFFTAKDPSMQYYRTNENLSQPFIWVQEDTAEFRFPYQGFDWLLRAGKGNYGAILYGAELGIYRKHSDRADAHYDGLLESEELQVSMELERCYVDEESGNAEWKHEFSRPYTTCSWFSGYKLNPDSTGIRETTEDPKYPDLRANYRLTVLDFEMLYALTAALEENGYFRIPHEYGIKPIDGAYAVRGLDIYFSF